jgi:hypothetical protein
MSMNSRRKSFLGKMEIQNAHTTGLLYDSRYCNL